VKKQHRAGFRIAVVIQVVLLVASILLLAWSILETGHLAVPAVVAAIVLLQVLGLVRYVESHVDTLEDFFAAVSYEDFTRRFIEDDVDAELKHAFNKVLVKFQDARAERDVQASYLDTVVRHVPVPFIAARSDGTVTLVNNPARRLLRLPVLTHLDQLAELDPALPRLLQGIEPGGQRMFQSRLGGVPAELRVSVAEIRMAAGIERLYSIENLSGELTAREASAWRNLIRVLTHEIMNTLTPIASLAQTTTGLLDNVAATDDIREAVQTIARRSEGLTRFVLRYRELLKVPVPESVNVGVLEALQSVVTLMSAELNGVEVVVDVSPDSLEVSADPGLLDQVLVNLVRNALDAMADSGSPKLILSGSLNFGRVFIAVKDNGPGIDRDVIEQVFVPFFTTRREGSGIGLTLSRQIMTAHSGEIAVDSDENGTVVRLIF